MQLLGFNVFEIRGTNVLTFLLPALQFCPLYDYLQRLHARCIIEIGIGHFENVSGRTVLGHEGKKIPGDWLLERESRCLGIKGLIPVIFVSDWLLIQAGWPEEYRCWIPVESDGA